jgi:hypothetical protein
VAKISGAVAFDSTIASENHARKSPFISYVEVANRKRRNVEPLAAHRLRNGLSLSMRVPAKRNPQLQKLPLGWFNAPNQGRRPSFDPYVCSTGQIPGS